MIRFKVVYLELKVRDQVPGTKGKAAITRYIRYLDT
jgi:hypothetical protein